MKIPLKLSEEQEQELLTLAAQFQQELENREMPFPKVNTVTLLREKLKATLLEQADFSTIWENTETKTDLLSLSHEKIKIRNLPWQVATEERPLLSIAKSYQSNLGSHQPTGFPLKVLIMVSSPEGVTRLAYEEEELQLLSAFSPLMSQGLAQVHFTDDGSLKNLKEKLEENKYHILHYTGHGSFRNEKGTLSLEDAINGREKEATAKELNDLLAEVHEIGHRPDLVVLSACQTARGEATNLSGVADTLLKGGIPAVIAMSASILDSCATLFARVLYTELSNGYPLPKSFQKARLAVKAFEAETYGLAKIGLAPGQWLIPQLLLNEQVAELVYLSQSGLGIK